MERPLVPPPFLDQITHRQVRTEYRTFTQSLERLDGISPFGQCMAVGGSYRNKPRHRFAMAGDDNFLTTFGSLEKRRKMSLGFECSNCLHNAGEILVELV